MAISVTTPANTIIEVEIGGILGMQTPAEWGSITGTLSDQEDLAAALALKQPIDADLTAYAASPTAAILANMPDALSGAGLHPGRLKISGISLPVEASGAYDEAGIVNGSQSYSRSTMVLNREVAGGWTLYTTSPSLIPKFYTTENEANVFEVTSWEAVSGSLGTMVVGLEAEPASFIGQLYLNTSTGVWYRWTGSAWDEDAGASSASDVTFTPSGSIAATNVQAALAELDTEKLANTAAAIITALGLMTKANLATANTDLAIGTLFYNTALSKLDITTA